MPARNNFVVSFRVMMATEKTSRFFGRKSAWLALLVIIAIAVAIVVAPVWIIQPFSPQTARGVAVSYAMRRWSPLITILSVLCAVFLVAHLWRGSRWWKKAILVIVFIPLFAVDLVRAAEPFRVDV